MTLYLSNNFNYRCLCSPCRVNSLPGRDEYFNIYYSEIRFYPLFPQNRLDIFKYYYGNLSIFLKIAQAFWNVVTNSHMPRQQIF